jgi:hypothetical protein
VLGAAGPGRIAHAGLSKISVHNGLDR